MADPLSIAAGSLAVTTAALQAATSLHQAIKSYKDRDKTLGRLREEIESLQAILTSLSSLSPKTIGTIDSKVLQLLGDPVKRCDRLCREFQQTMQGFFGKEKTGLRDRRKLYFMKGDITEFTDTIATYKSTFTVGLGIISLHHMEVKHGVLADYCEIVADTAHNLELRLQRLEEKLELPSDEVDIEPSNTRSSSIDLEDEVAVTKQCLLLCQKGKQFMETLLAEESDHTASGTADGSDKHLFEAQRHTRAVLVNNREQLAEIVGQLAGRLRKLTKEDERSTLDDRQQLQADISMSKQCLEICNMADTETRQKTYKVAEAIADDNSDQIVANTISDFFDVGKIVSKNNSAQFVGSVTPENLDLLVESRYKSRFGTIASSGSEIGSSAVQATAGDGIKRAQENMTKPTSNETRKRLD